MRAPAHYRCEPSRELHLRDVQAHRGKLGFDPPANPRNTACGVRIDPGVRFGRCRVAALCVRTAHQGEPSQQVGKTRLLRQRERHDGERARGDQQDLSGRSRAGSTRNRAAVREDAPGRNRRLGMPDPRSRRARRTARDREPAGAMPPGDLEVAQASSSSTASVFVATSTVTLPITVVAPISSTSGEAAACSRASASSTPVSTSRIRGVGLMDRELPGLRSVRVSR